MTREKITERVCEQCGKTFLGRTNCCNIECHHQKRTGFAPSEWKKDERPRYSPPTIVKKDDEVAEVKLGPEKKTKGIKIRKLFGFMKKSN